MTEAMFQRVLERAEAHSDRGDRLPIKLPDEKTVTLYAANNGATMTVANVTELLLRDSVLEAKNRKGELFLLALQDVYAASINASDERGGSRKAGFIR